MLRNIIKYGGLALVIIGIVLVMRNLFKSDTEWNNSKNKKDNKVVTSYYSAKVNLLDKETGVFIDGASLSIKDKTGQVISTWKTEEGAHLVTNLPKGKYTLIEEEAPEHYNINSEGVSFEIKDKDTEVTMYNEKMTEEEYANYVQEQRRKNTTSTEVGVDNTLSIKSPKALFLAIISIFVGISMMFSSKKVS